MIICQLTTQCIKQTFYSIVLSQSNVLLRLIRLKFAEKFEVDFFAVQQNGWDDSTHGVSWYFRDEDQYAKSGLIFTTSQAGREFRKTMNDIGLKLFPIL